MQIQLKQVEIVTALKQYITQQGIDLSAKHVVINFTAGRKESGITADLSIEDTEIPGFTESDKEPAVLTLVAAAPVEESAAEPEAEAPAPAKSVSLFS